MSDHTVKGNRGGRRTGAGAKPRPAAPHVEIDAAALRSLSPEDMLRAAVPIAIAALVAVAAAGASELARVRAAQLLLEHGKRSAEEEAEARDQVEVGGWDDLLPAATSGPTRAN